MAKKTKTKSKTNDRPKPIRKNRARRLRRVLRTFVAFGARLEKNVVPRLTDGKDTAIEKPDIKGLPNTPTHLQEELQDWAKGMEKGGMGHLPKHAEVLEASDALDDVIEATADTVKAFEAIPSQVEGRGAKPAITRIRAFIDTLPALAKACAEVRFPGQFGVVGPGVTVRPAKPRKVGGRKRTGGRKKRAGGRKKSPAVAPAAPPVAP